MARSSTHRDGSDGQAQRELDVLWWSNSAGGLACRQCRTYMQWRGYVNPGLCHKHTSRRASCSSASLPKPSSCGGPCDEHQLTCYIGTSHARGHKVVQKQQRPDTHQPPHCPCLFLACIKHGANRPGSNNSVAVAQTRRTCRGRNSSRPGTSAMRASASRAIASVRMTVWMFGVVAASDSAFMPRARDRSVPRGMAGPTVLSPTLAQPEHSWCSLRLGRWLAD